MWGSAVFSCRVDRRWGGAPVLVHLESPGTSPQLLPERFVGNGVAPAEEEHVNRPRLHRFQHALRPPGSGRGESRPPDGRFTTPGPPASAQVDSARACAGVVKAISTRTTRDVAAAEMKVAGPSTVLQPPASRCRPIPSSCTWVAPLLSLSDAAKMRSTSCGAEVSRSSMTPLHWMPARRAHRA